MGYTCFTDCVHPKKLHRGTHDKQISSQRKCREHLSNQPSQRDNVTHQGISISQPCYEDEWMECIVVCEGGTVSMARYMNFPELYLCCLERNQS